MPTPGLMMIQEKEASLVVEPVCMADDPLLCLHMLHYSADDPAAAEAGLSGGTGARSP